MTNRTKLLIALAASACLLGLVASARAHRAPSETPRLSCDRPASLRLRRFEDGSAQLRCGHRLLVRVSSPG